MRELERPCHLHRRSLYSNLVMVWRLTRASTGVILFTAAPLRLQGNSMIGYGNKVYLLGWIRGKQKVD
jgi:hypothetical protein